MQKMEVSDEDGEERSGRERRGTDLSYILRSRISRERTSVFHNCSQVLKLGHQESRRLGKFD